MSRRNRPTAFDISFPDESTGRQTPSLSSSARSRSSTPSVSGHGSSLSRRSSTTLFSSSTSSTGRLSTPSSLRKGGGDDVFRGMKVEGKGGREEKGRSQSLGSLRDQGKDKGKGKEKEREVIELDSDDDDSVMGPPSSATPSARSTPVLPRSRDGSLSLAGRQRSVGGGVAAAGEQKGGKRKSFGGGEESEEEGVRGRSAIEKRAKMGKKPVVRYYPKPTDMKENSDTEIYGEDSDYDELDEGPSSTVNTGKPVRLLSDFAIFDPGHGLGMHCLSLLDTNDGVNRQFEAAGAVRPQYVNEEDEGQEDDGDDGDKEGVRQRIRTSAIWKYCVDFTVKDDPVWIETHYAWYILTIPSKEYRSIYYSFYRPLRVAQLFIANAVSNERWTYDTFRTKLLDKFDTFLDKRLDEALIKSSMSVILSAIDVVEKDHPEYRIRTRPIIKDLLNDIDLLDSSYNYPSPTHSQAVPAAARNLPSSSHPRSANPFTSDPLNPMYLTGNLDLAVLDPKNQNQTHVTPLVDKLSAGLFEDHLKVIGARPKEKDSNEQAELKAAQAKLKKRLLEVCGKWHALVPNSKVTMRFPGNMRIREQYWEAIVVDGVTYSVGDTILFQAQSCRGKPPLAIPHPRRDSIPPEATLADYFWFGKIIFIGKDSKKFHVRYFEHASKTIMQEISDPQELFLTDTCGVLSLYDVLGKVTVRYQYKDLLEQGRNKMDPTDFFCKMLYNEVDASFTSLPDNKAFLASLPPDNCPVCARSTQRAQDESPYEIKDGVAYHGTSFHLNDFVMIKSEVDPNEESIHAKANPCEIGQIISVSWTSRTKRASSDIVTVLVLGRISDIIDVCPWEVVKDERHLFLTNLQKDIPIKDLVQKCRVVHPGSFSTEAFTHYLSHSPFNFFAKYRFPKLRVDNWDQKAELLPSDILVCPSCCKEDLILLKKERAFLEHVKRKPLKAFDPFAGVGAFGLGLEESDVIKVTHAIEISPSAATTLKNNSPHTTVYNQCSNIVLQYAMKSYQLKNSDAKPVSIKEQQPLPDPPKPSDIDCIIAGFPCQSHSMLNLFQKANDKKSYLILNLLSWVDFLKPKVCFFENVRGFLRFNLKAKQATRFKVTGGIEMGGLKFLIRSLIAMNYQIQFGLLQAAHYGAPQSRVRFFLTAALDNFPLPNIPQPTHQFPVRDQLKLNFPGYDTVQPVRSEEGKAAYRYVTVDDAISDLTRFDWSLPAYTTNNRTIHHPEHLGEDFRVSAIFCQQGKEKCGPSRTVYHYSIPKTSYQVKSREKRATQLQHFTRVLKEPIIRRVINIPLDPKADYKVLNAEHWEWQLTNPYSANAKAGFKSGWYGRIDKDAWFHTTITNVEPTAKQSWVLNPYCKRVVTVRELARSQGFPDSFTFYTYNNSIKTMHRQIGNAVPWPVGEALGRELRISLFQKWIDDEEAAKDAIEIDDDDD